MTTKLILELVGLTLDLKINKVVKVEVETGGSLSVVTLTVLGCPSEHIFLNDKLAVQKLQAAIEKVKAL